MIVQSLDVTQAEQMACKHAISESRVAYWWDLVAQRAKGPGHLHEAEPHACGCCTGPVGELATAEGKRYYPAYCRFCRGGGVEQPRMPYGEAAR